MCTCVEEDDTVDVIFCKKIEISLITWDQIIEKCTSENERTANLCIQWEYQYL